MNRALRTLFLLFLSGLITNPVNAQTIAESPLVISMFQNLYSFHITDAKKDLTDIASEDIHQDTKDICSANYHWWNIVTKSEYSFHKTKMLKAVDGIIGRYSNIPVDQLDPDAVFALSHAYAYKTRLDMYEDNYIKGANNLKQAVKLFDVILPGAEENIKFKLLAGLYHYILGSVLERYPIFNPLFVFSPKTDINKGLQYLQYCAKSPHPLISTEASYFLLRVQYEVGKKHEMADQTVLYLLNKYPENQYFRATRIYILADSGRENECRAEYRKLKTSFNSLQVPKAQQDFIMQETDNYLRKKRIKF